MHWPLLLITFEVAQQTECTEIVQRPAVKLEWDSYKPERYGIADDKKQETRANGFDLNVLNLHLNYIRPKGYLTSGTDEF